MNVRPERDLIVRLRRCRSHGSWPAEDGGQVSRFPIQHTWPPGPAQPGQHELELVGHRARRWEPKKPRYRLLAIPATLARTAQPVVLHLSGRSPWADLTLTGLTRLADLAPG